MAVRAGASHALPCYPILASRLGCVQESPCPYLVTEVEGSQQQERSRCGPVQPPVMFLQTFRFQKPAAEEKKAWSGCWMCWFKLGMACPPWLMWHFPSLQQPVAMLSISDKPRLCSRVGSAVKHKASPECSHPLHRNLQTCPEPCSAEGGSQNPL